MLYTAPSPQRKKESGRENKLRLFLKRSSEPLLNLQNQAEKVIIAQFALHSFHVDAFLRVKCLCAKVIFLSVFV